MRPKGWRRMRRGRGLRKRSNCFDVLLLKQTGKHKRDLWNSAVASIPVPVCLTAVPSGVSSVKVRSYQEQRVGLLRLSKYRGQGHWMLSKTNNMIIFTVNLDHSLLTPESGWSCPFWPPLAAKFWKKPTVLKETTSKEKKGGGPNVWL